MRLLIKNGYFITLDAENRVYERGSVLIDEGKIAGLATLGSNIT